MSKICDGCIKADVCMFKEECMKAVKDIQDICGRTNVFIKADISCEKRKGYQITNRGEINLGKGVKVTMG